MIASVIFQCSKVSTTPIYAIIIENPVPPIITITGKKSTDPSRHQGERVREEGTEHKEQEQEQEASRRRPETRPKCSDPSLLGASLTLGMTSCRPKAQSILRWHAVSVWRRGGAFWKPSILVSCPSESNPVFRMFQRNAML